MRTKTRIRQHKPVSVTTLGLWAWCHERRGQSTYTVSRANAHARRNTTVCRVDESRPIIRHFRDPYDTRPCVALFRCLYRVFFRKKMRTIQNAYRCFFLISKNRMNQRLSIFLGPLPEFSPENLSWPISFYIYRVKKFKKQIS